MPLKSTSNLFRMIVRPACLKCSYKIAADRFLSIWREFMLSFILKSMLKALLEMVKIALIFHYHRAQFVRESLG